MPIRITTVHDFVIVVVVVVVVVGMICAIPQGVFFVRDRAGDTVFLHFQELRLGRYKAQDWGFKTQVTAGYGCGSHYRSPSFARVLDW
jgi:hypothetical protein